MASDTEALAALVKISSEALELARSSAEKVLATATGEQRAEIERAISLLNQALDAQADAGQHDDRSEY